MLSPKQIAIKGAEKARAIHAYEPELDEGQKCVRRLWLRPEVAELLDGSRLEDRQRAAVHAALKRFATGGRFTVLRPGSTVPVEAAGDIKVLEHADRLTVEVRFRPPRHELRLFGRFIDRNALVITSFGMKARGSNRLAKGEQPLNYARHIDRCQTFMTASLRVDCPQEIDNCITNARIR